MPIPDIEGTVGARQVPPDVVNWTDADRISQVDALPSGGYLWARREYVADRDDPNEGRRTAVSFFDHNSSETHPLESDCPDFSYAAQTDLVVVVCAREVAADNLFHTIDLFRKPGLKKIASVEHCRKPQFSGAVLSCEEEQVGPDGKLRLTPKHLHLNGSVGIMGAPS